MAEGKIENKNAYSHTTAIIKYKNNKPAHLYKRGNIVDFYSTDDWVNYPAGDMGIIGTIPSGYRPMNVIKTADPTSYGRDIIVIFNSNGNIAGYNYGEGKTVANGAIHACWMTD